MKSFLTRSVHDIWNEKPHFGRHSATLRLADFLLITFDENSVFNSMIRELSDFRKSLSLIGH